MNDQKPATVPTEISCKAPDAQKVYLAGTFNNWNDVLIPMKRQENGIWMTSIDLSPGRHEYKFIVDGEWCCTPYCSDQATCVHCVTNEHGTMNRVIEIP